MTERQTVKTSSGEATRRLSSHAPRTRNRSFSFAFTLMEVCGLILSMSVGSASPGPSHNSSATRSALLVTVIPALVVPALVASALAVSTFFVPCPWQTRSIRSAPPVSASTRNSCWHAPASLNSSPIFVPMSRASPAGTVSISTKCPSGPTHETVTSSIPSLTSLNGFGSPACKSRYQSGSPFGR
eukprot:scaffold52297_cov63-Phaeocystis_antarctica.AAC.4